MFPSVPDEHVVIRQLKRDVRQKKKHVRQKYNENS